MSVSQLTSQYIPATLDGLNVGDFDQIYIDGKEIVLTDYVRYQGSDKEVDLNSQRISTTYPPSAINDLTNKFYVDVADNLRVLKSGDTMTGALIMGNNKITSTYVPLNNEDLINYGKLQDYTYSKSQVYTKQEVDTGLAQKVNKSGDTMSGNLIYSPANTNTIAIFNNSKELTSSSCESSKLTYIQTLSENVQDALNNRYTISQIQSLYYDKTFIDNNFYTKTASDNLYYNKTFIDNNFYTKTGSDARYLQLTGGSLSNTSNSNLNLLTLINTSQGTNTTKAVKTRFQLSDTVGNLKDMVFLSAYPLNQDCGQAIFKIAVKSSDTYLPSDMVDKLVISKDESYFENYITSSWFINGNRIIYTDTNKRLVESSYDISALSDIDYLSQNQTISGNKTYSGLNNLIRYSSQDFWKLTGNVMKSEYDYNNSVFFYHMSLDAIAQYKELPSNQAYVSLSLPALGYNSTTPRFITCDNTTNTTLKFITDSIFNNTPTVNTIVAKNDRFEFNQSVYLPVGASFHVGSDFNNSLRMHQSGSACWIDFNGQLTIRRNNNGTLNNVMNLYTDGYVSIGPESGYFSNKTRLLINGDNTFNQLHFKINNQSTDNKYWGWGPNSNNFYGYVSNDTGSFTQNWIEVNRSSVFIQKVCFPNSPVGIGTTNPEQILDVRGNFQCCDVNSSFLTFTSYLGANFIQSGGVKSPSVSSSAFLHFSPYYSGTGSITMDIYNKRLGIGNMNPQLALDVNGQGTFTDLLYAKQFISYGSQPDGGYWLTGDITDARWRISIPGGYELGFYRNISGTPILRSYIDSGGAYNQVSDKTVKSDIQPLNTEKSLKKILLMKPSHYIYNGSPNNERSIGFIAQDLQEINPYCVNKCIYQNIGEEKIQKLSVSYNDILIHSVGAIQELTKALQQERNERILLKKEFEDYKNLTELRFNKLAELIKNLV